PIVFKSYEEYDSATAAPSNAPAEATTITTMSNTLATTSKSGFLPNGLHEWFPSVFDIVISVATSGGFVGGCCCGIKCIRNGCVCKRSWFRRKGNKIFMIEIGHNQQHSSTSSSPTTSSS
ncbi:unnamed protein product, partial [Rotaria sp. Silwood1]